ncbi:SacI domain [Musa troglodytarum]|uniref:SacI domain n=1 Tax=Musa troglodytarum TaxID=320322 RepID=A0A9E7FQG7_9LILI|nr:SacI domain [Musa troglodytarum]
MILFDMQRGTQFPPVLLMEGVRKRKMSRENPVLTCTWHPTTHTMPPPPGELFTFVRPPRRSHVPLKRTAALRSGRSHSRFAGRPHRETRTFRSLHLRLSRPYLCSFPFPRLLLSSPRRPHCRLVKPSSLALEKTMEAEFSVLLNAAEGTSGTRMWRRGADMEGYVANFVESEQILQSNGFTASFVQVRGSMPFLWEQIVDLTYKPKFEIVRAEEASRVAERHFLDLSNKYGSVLAVDLVNKHGSEGRLSERFANAMQTIRNDDIRYVHFDFHQICGHIHFERLSLLYNQIEDYLNKHGYFLLNEKGEKVSGQTGVVRTNCIDCLDRTNVTQSMIARKALESQLKQIGIFGSDDSISAYPYFDASYKILWANHGDHISIQYSGTPALKGDFVRYGKRTVQGILKDGWNAMARYYLNNFVDGTKQDAIDLLQGHYIVSLSRDMSSPTKAGALETYALKSMFVTYCSHLFGQV